MLEFPKAISKLSAEGGEVEAADSVSPAQRRVTLPAGQRVSLEIQLK